MGMKQWSFVQFPGVMVASRRNLLGHREMGIFLRIGRKFGVGTKYRKNPGRHGGSLLGTGVGADSERLPAVCVIRHSAAHPVCCAGPGRSFWHGVAGALRGVTGGDLDHAPNVCAESRGSASRYRVDEP